MHDLEKENQRLKNQIKTLLEEKKGLIKDNQILQGKLTGLEERLEDTQAEICTLLQSIRLPLPKDNIYKISIEDLDISVRLFNCLRSANITTLGAITNKTKNELFEIKYFGKSTMRELEVMLHEKKLSLLSKH